MFIAWLQRGELLGAGLHVPWDYRSAGEPAIPDERRLAILRRLLEDRSIDPRDRFAGSVLLLYAQPLTRIARIRISDIATTSDGAITLTIGRGRFTLPEPLASIALALRYERILRSGEEGWLLPGRHPGTPVSADNLRLRLKRYDITSCPGTPQRAARARSTTPGADPRRPPRAGPITRRAMGASRRRHLPRLRRDPHTALSRRAVPASRRTSRRPVL
jgi:hypothetical protein